MAIAKITLLFLLSFQMVLLKFQCVQIVFSICKKIIPQYKTPLTKLTFFARHEVNVITQSRALLGSVPWSRKVVILQHSGSFVHGCAVDSMLCPHLVVAFFFLLFSLVMVKSDTRSGDSRIVDDLEMSLWTLPKCVYNDKHESSSICLNHAHGKSTMCTLVLNSVVFASPFHTKMPHGGCMTGCGTAIGHKATILVSFQVTSSEAGGGGGLERKHPKMVQK